MMPHVRRGSAPASQNALITKAEGKLLERRRMIKIRLSVLSRTIRNQLASPVMLLGAVELGFAVDQLAKRPPVLPPRNAERANYEPFGRLLKLVALARSVSNLLTPAPDANTRLDPDSAP